MKPREEYLEKEYRVKYRDGRLLKQCIQRQDGYCHLNGRLLRKHNLMRALYFCGNQEKRSYKCHANPLSHHTGLFLNHPPGSFIIRVDFVLGVGITIMPGITCHVEFIVTFIPKLMHAITNGLKPGKPATTCFIILISVSAT